MRAHPGQDVAKQLTIPVDLNNRVVRSDRLVLEPLEVCKDNAAEATTPASAGFVACAASKNCTTKRFARTNVASEN